VLMDPWAPLSPGLWLSFGAVLLIFYAAAGWNSPGSAPAQWLRVQWAITVGLAPAALLLFGQISVAGPLANAVAIPLVSVVITPLALLAAVVPIDALLHFCAWLVQWLLEFLEWCAALPGALWQQHVPAVWTVIAALPRCSRLSRSKRWPPRCRARMRSMALRRMRVAARRAMAGHGTACASSSCIRRARPRQSAMI